MVNWEHSYKFGKSSENKIYPIIKQYFNNDDIEQTMGRYAKYDYICPKYNYECKSRTNTFNKYPDTMITMNKIQNVNKPLILLFNFLDALYYIEYEPVLFSTFKRQWFSRAKEEWDEKIHIFIPTEHLIHIHTWTGV